MIVDDNADLVDTLAHYLGNHGFDVESMTSGALALQRLESPGCDVVLTDLDIDQHGSPAYPEYVITSPQTIEPEAIASTSKSRAPEPSGLVPAGFGSK